VPKAEGLEVTENTSDFKAFFYFRAKQKHAKNSIIKHIFVVKTVVKKLSNKTDSTKMSSIYTRSGARTRP